MARSPSSLWLVLALVGGVVIGIAVDRSGGRVVAQGPALAQPTTSSTPAPSGKAVSDDDLYAQLARQYEQFAPVNRTFELVSKAVSPCVVHVVAHKVRRESNHRIPFEESGSGVIVRDGRSNDRYVLTNHHVIDGSNAGEIEVFLLDGRALKPTKIWLDGLADIAVLKLGVVELPSARLGNSDDAAVGSWVLALGSPFGLTHSVSQGIISARGRHEQELHDDGVENQDFLQTDAAINPGNSGGPLVNLKGEVIGINTAIASKHGGSEGVGFSIPINLAKWIMTQLINNGRVSRGAMGVILDQVHPDQAEVAGLNRPRGARVTTVYEDSPALQAGVREGDIIVGFNGVEVADLNHLINLVSMATIGQSAKVALWRELQEFIVTVKIGEKDAVLAKTPTANDPVRPRSDSLLRRQPRPPAQTVPPAQGSPR